MKPQLKNGKILPPKSFVDACKRKRQVAYEMDQIFKQLADPKREGWQGAEAYARWAKSAQGALKVFDLEYRQLDEWLRPRLINLFKETYDFVKDVQIDLAEDLEPHEVDLIKNLDAYFEKDHRREG